jgi:hypothetical protein
MRHQPTKRETNVIHKKQTIEVRLPGGLIAPLSEIAKLAGLSVESVIKLALATEVWRWQREQQVTPNNQVERPR